MSTRGLVPFAGAGCAGGGCAGRGGPVTSDRGSPSSLTLRAVGVTRGTITRRALRRRGGRIELRGAVVPASPGTLIVVSRRETGGDRWRQQRVRVAPDGSFSTRFTLRHSASFVAQWAGDATHAGDGTVPLTVRVRG